jgi:hypothetical protein
MKPMFVLHPADFLLDYIGDDYSKKPTLANVNKYFYAN